MSDEASAPQESRASAGRECPDTAGPDPLARIERLEAELARTRHLVHEADHRAKNTLQVVTSLVLLQARRLADAPTPQVLHAIADRVNALAIAHRLLAENLHGRFDVAAFLREIGTDLQPGDRVALSFDLGPAEIAAGKAPSFALLLHEILANALQHAHPDGASGRVSVSAGLVGDRLQVTIADDGRGEPDAWTGGFGLMLVDLLGRQLRAQISREPAHPGTRVTIAMQAEGAEAPVRPGRPGP